MLKLVFAFIFSATMIHSALAEVVVDWDIKKLEDKFRSEIETGVKEYLGPDKKFKVYVQVNGKKKSEEKKAVDFNDKEFGYLSVADSYQDVKVSEKVFVNSVSADIFIYEKFDRSVENNIKKIASGAMKGFPNTTNLNIMPSPKIEEKKKDDAKPEAPKEPPFDLNKFLLEHASDIFKMVSTIFMGMLGLLGVYLLAKSLMAAFKSIGDAMKASTDKYTKQQQMNKEQELDAKKKDEEKAASQKIEEVFNNQLEVQFERNIDIVKSCLRTSPHIFKQILNRKEENLNGLKTLLPLIVEYTIKLKEAISPEVWRKLEAVNGIDEGMFNRWLNTFAEDISVAQMTENGYFSYVVDHSLLEKVYSAKFTHLVDASMRVNSSILYKFVLDFLPPEESTALMQHFDEETWRMVLTERYVNAVDLNGDIARMLKVVEEMVEKEKREINDQGLARILANPMTFFLQSKSFEESEEFFDILSSSAPDLASMLKSKFWTPRMLYRIPEHYLSEKFNTLSIEKRVSILLGVQEELRNYLLGFVPEGKVMTIITDQYNRDVENFDQKQKDKSIKTIKEFLEVLKTESMADKFSLKEETENLEEHLEDVQVVADEVPEITSTREIDNETLEAAETENKVAELRPESEEKPEVVEDSSEDEAA